MVSSVFPKMKMGKLGFGNTKNHFWEIKIKNGKIFGKYVGNQKERFSVRKKNYKGRCEKRTLSKCTDVCRTYDPIQYAYADILEKDSEVREIKCNVVLSGDEESEYMTDFLCVKIDNDMFVRECVSRKYLMKPLTVKLLDMSKEYWERNGVTDWGIVIDEE